MPIQTHRNLKCKRIATVLLSLISLFCLGCDDQTQSSEQLNGPTAKLAKIEGNAQAGDVTQQLLLAKKYENGDGATKDQKLAFDWYLKAANAGNTDAMLQVAHRYFSGLGIAKDNASAIGWLDKASDAGQKEAQYERSQRYGFLFLFSKGQVMVFGETVEQMERNAQDYVSWLTRAATSREPRAQFELAAVQLQGIKKGSFGAESSDYLIPPQANTSDAMTMLEDSANTGYWNAQRVLASIFQMGFRDIKADPTESEKWWLKLEQQGDPATQVDLGNYYSWDDKNSFPGRKFHGRSLDFEQSNKLALDWYLRASAQGNARGAYFAGEMLGKSTGGFPDQAQALQQFKKAADLGSPDAMFALGLNSYNGKGVPKDFALAKDWFIRAVNAEGINGTNTARARAESGLGYMYEFGYGVKKDLVISYAWYNLASAESNEFASKEIARIEQLLKPDEIAEAQEMTRSWAPGINLARTHSSTAELSREGSTNVSRQGIGSGFFVSANGHLLTNSHVAGHCREIRIPALGKTATLTVADSANDLALIQVQGEGFPVAEFAKPGELKQGQEIALFGYPLEGFLPASGNFTAGIVSALAGPGNNSSLIQITAPVQPGNSGGPVLNKKGQVVGVVVGKADVIKLSKMTNDIAQNINFAISGGTAIAFLDGNHVPYAKAGLSLLKFERDSAEVAEIARGISIKIECWN